PELTPVRGTVYYKGVPLRGGTIVFAPDPARGCCGPLAQAEIRPDGTYSLRTDGARGAAPGWHLITVAAASAARLPRRYSDPELSGLCQEVRAERVNTIDLHLD